MIEVVTKEVVIEGREMEMVVKVVIKARREV